MESEIYETTPLAPVDLPSWDFVMPRQEPCAKRRLDEVMHTEVLISCSLLINRISSVYGIFHKTARLVAWMDDILSRTPYYKWEADELTSYRNMEEEAEAYTKFCIDSKYKVADLPPREAASVALSILE